MIDINFFEGYTKKPKYDMDRKSILYLMILILIIIHIFYVLYNQIKILKFSREVDRLQFIIENEEINNKIKTIREKQTEVENLEESLKKIQILDNYIKEDSVINGYLLDNINSKIPQEIFFTSINIHTDNIQIVGNSKEKQSIAQLAYNLETIAEFKDIFISNIALEGEYYNFSLNIRLKDVNTDGEEEFPRAN